MSSGAESARKRRQAGFCSRTARTSSNVGATGAVYREQTWDQHPDMGTAPATVTLLYQSYSSRRRGQRAKTTAQKPRNSGELGTWAQTRRRSYNSCCNNVGIAPCYSKPPIGVPTAPVHRVRDCWIVGHKSAASALGSVAV